MNFGIAVWYDLRDEINTLPSISHEYRALFEILRKLYRTVLFDKPLVAQEVSVSKVLIGKKIQYRDTVSYPKF
jgi:hypothetical protein